MSELLHMMPIKRREFLAGITTGALSAGLAACSHYASRIVLFLVLAVAVALVAVSLGWSTSTPRPPVSRRRR